MIEGAVSKMRVHIASKLGDNPSNYVLELEQYNTGQKEMNVVRNFVTEYLLTVWKKVKLFCFELRISKDLLENTQIT